MPFAVVLTLAALGCADSPSPAALPALAPIERELRPEAPALAEEADPATRDDERGEEPPPARAPRPSAGAALVPQRACGAIVGATRAGAHHAVALDHDGVACLVDARTGAVLAARRLFDGAGLGVAVDERGHLALAWGRDARAATAVARVWDLPADHVRDVAHGRSVDGAPALSSDGLRAAFLSGGALLIAPTSGEPGAETAAPGANGVRFHPRGRLVATYGPGGVVVRDGWNGQPLSGAPSVPSAIHAVEFRADGRELLAAGAHRLWVLEAHDGGAATDVGPVRGAVWVRYADDGAPWVCDADGARTPGGAALAVGPGGCASALVDPTTREVIALDGGALLRRRPDRPDERLEDPPAEAALLPGPWLRSPSGLHRVRPDGRLGALLRAGPRAGLRDWEIGETFVAIATDAGEVVHGERRPAAPAEPEAPPPPARAIEMPALDGGAVPDVLARSADGTRELTALDVRRDDGVTETLYHLRVASRERPLDLLPTRPHFGHLVDGAPARAGGVFSPDGRTLAVTSSAGTYLHDEDGRRLGHARGGHVTFVPDSSGLLIEHADGEVGLYGMDGRRRGRALPAVDGDPAPVDLAFGPGVVVAARGRAVFVTDVAAGRSLPRIVAPATRRDAPRVAHGAVEVPLAGGVAWYSLADGALVRRLSRGALRGRDDEGRLAVCEAGTLVLARIDDPGPGVPLGSCPTGRVRLSAHVMGYDDGATVTLVRLRDGQRLSVGVLPLRRPLRYAFTPEGRFEVDTHALGEVRFREPGPLPDASVSRVDPAAATPDLVRRFLAGEALGPAG